MNRDLKLRTRRKSSSGLRTYRAKTNIRKQRKTRAAVAEPMAHGPVASGRRISRAMMIMIILHVLAVVGFVVHNQRYENAPTNPPSQKDHMIGSSAPAINTGNGGIHIVKRGESYSSIASQYGITVGELKKANRGKEIADGMHLKVPPAKIQPSESLEDMAAANDAATAAEPVTPEVIKPKKRYDLTARRNESSAPQPSPRDDFQPVKPEFKVAPVEPAQPVVAAAERIHIVRSGDTLYRISRKYDVSVGEIKRLNGLRSDNIGIGRELRIP